MNNILKIRITISRAELGFKGQGFGDLKMYYRCGGAICKSKLLLAISLNFLFPSVLQFFSN